MLAVPFLIGCLDRTPETYHSVGIRRGTATSNFHLQRDNLGWETWVGLFVHRCQKTTTASAT